MLKHARSPSKLNTTDDVPAIPAAESPVVPVICVLLTPIQAADVADIQLLVAQSTSATTAVTVASLGPKFVPARVTLAEAETTLYGFDAVRTGAVRSKEMTGIKVASTLKPKHEPHRRS